MAPSWVRGAPLSPLRLFALVTLLLSGVVKSDNYTELLFNQTVTTVDHDTPLNVNVTDKDLHRIEMESNGTLITEDDEAFQDMENKLQPQCNEEMLRNLGFGICAEQFYIKMKSVREDKWCILEEVIRAYNEMTECLELVSHMMSCFYPNPIVQELFLQTHAHFFGNCSRDEPDFMDPPPALVLTLTLLPVTLIPALVFMVVWKNQAQK